LGLSPVWSIHYDVTKGSNRGYAFVRRTPPVVEIAPITDSETFIVALHEVGHVATRDECRPPLHHLVPSDPKFPNIDKVCVRCELTAWRQAIRWVSEDGPRVKPGLCWSPSMHAHMVRRINSYAQYATTAERVAIDQLCSPTTRIAAVCRALAMIDPERTVRMTESDDAETREDDLEYSDLQRPRVGASMREIRSRVVQAFASGTPCSQCGARDLHLCDLIGKRSADGSIQVLCRQCSVISAIRQTISEARERRAAVTTPPRQEEPPPPLVPPEPPFQRRPLVRKKVVRDARGRISEIIEQAID
jgi:hypothetical protein